jgi:hypothetical protein
VGHLWIRVCEAVALADGLLKMWHMRIIFREGVALVERGL